MRGRKDSDWNRHCKDEDGRCHGYRDGQRYPFRKENCDGLVPTAGASLNSFRNDVPFPIEILDGDWKVQTVLSAQSRGQFVVGPDAGHFKVGNA